MLPFALVMTGIESALLALLILYAWRTVSGHTGVSLSSLHAVFLSFAFSGFSLLLVGREGTGRSGFHAVLAMVLAGLAGSALLVVLPAAGILQSYEDWLRLGQPQRSAWSEHILTAFGGGVALVFLVLAAAAILGGGREPSAPPEASDTVSTSCR